MCECHRMCMFEFRSRYEWMLVYKDDCHTVYI